MARHEYRIHPIVQNKPDDFLGGNGKLIVKVSEEIGKQTSGRFGVAISQIRKIFGDFKRQQYREFNINKIQLIRPKLAYIFSRHDDKQGMDLLLGTIDFLIDQTKEKAHFDNIINLFEAIIAYHKKYGGK